MEWNDRTLGLLDRHLGDLVMLAHRIATALEKLESRAQSDLRIELRPILRGDQHDTTDRSRAAK